MAIKSRDSSMQQPTSQGLESRLGVTWPPRPHLIGRRLKLDSVAFISMQMKVLHWSINNRLIENALKNVQYGELECNERIRDER